MSDGSQWETSNPLWKLRLDDALKDYANINWRIGFTDGKFDKRYESDADKAETIRQVIMLLAGKG